MTNWSLTKKAEVIQFIKAHIIYASPRIQWVQPKAKFTGFWNSGIHHLAGDSYLYWCHRCLRSITQHELPSVDALMKLNRSFEQAVIPHCPGCLFPLDINQIRKGDKVIMHFRYAADGVPRGKTKSGATTWEVHPSWAGWYAEKVLDWPVGI